MRKVLLLLLFVLSYWGESFAQAQVEVAMDSSQALIGSPLKLRMDIGPVPPGTEIAWPQVPDSFRALARTGEPIIDTVQAGNAVRYLREYPFVGLDSGVFDVPSLTFKIGDETVQSALSQIYLYPIDVDTSQPIEPIRDIIAAPSYFDWKPWAIGAAVAIILAILVWLFLRRKKKSSAPVAVKAPLKGFASLLKELEAEGLPQKGEYRLYYTRLTDILRDAIAVRSGIAAREMTSAQLLRRTEKTFNEMTQAQLRSILGEADAVKFAKFQPTLSTQEEVMRTAFAFLQNARL